MQLCPDYNFQLKVMTTISILFQGNRLNLNLKVNSQQDAKQNSYWPQFEWDKLLILLKC